jgi:hypothetical protein
MEGYCKCCPESADLGGEREKEREKEKGMERE